MSTSSQACRSARNDRTSRYGAAALRSAEQRVAAAAAGLRNDTLFREAVGVAELIAGGVLDEAQAHGRLRAAAMAAGLPVREFEATWTSALLRGRRTPRVAPRQSQRADRRLTRSSAAAAQSQTDQDQVQILRARRLVAAAQPAGPLVGAYLAKRGLAGVASPALFETARSRLGGHKRPAMLAAIVDDDGAARCAQSTAIDPLTFTRARTRDGALLKKKSIGRMGDGAVRLLEPEGATSLIIGEGVESALSLHRLVLERGGHAACWATLGVGRFTSIALPAQPGALVIAADRGALAARKSDELAKKAAHQGWRVEIATPPDGYGDWNDYLVGR